MALTPGVKEDVAFENLTNSYRAAGGYKERERARPIQLRVRILLVQRPRNGPDVRFREHARQHGQNHSILISVTLLGTYTTRVHDDSIRASIIVVASTVAAVPRTPGPLQEPPKFGVAVDVVAIESRRAHLLAAWLVRPIRSGIVSNPGGANHADG